MAKGMNINPRKMQTGGAKPNSMVALERNLPRKGGNNAPNGDGMTMNPNARNGRGKTALPQ